MDVYLDDDETEEEWRRKRHEREMFLKKVTADVAVYSLKIVVCFFCVQEMEKSQRFSQDEDPLEGLTDSEILKLGQAALRKTQQNTPNEKTVAEKTPEPFMPTFSVIYKNFRLQCKYFCCNFRVNVDRF